MSNQFWTQVCLAYNYFHFLLCIKKQLTGRRKIIPRKFAVTLAKTLNAVTEYIFLCETIHIIQYKLL